MPTLSEAQVIARLTSVSAARGDVVLGIGDDGAVLDPPAGQHLVSVLDTLNEGVHFPAGTPAAAVGHRALAVNLSDLAAMGAQPAWACLSLSLPEADAGWVEAFADGIRELCSRWGVALVGGDTVRGPLSIAVHLTGFVEPGRALTRHGACPGDLLFVTGEPGVAAGGLALIQRGETESPLIRRFLWPQPRIDEGRALAGLATSAIDLSDGLATDLARVAAASGVRIVVDADKLPVAPDLIARFGPEAAKRHVVSGGDDYEIAFTVAEEDAPALAATAERWACQLTRIGRVESGEGLVFERAGRRIAPDLSSVWRHFSGDSA